MSGAKEENIEIEPLQKTTKKQQLNFTDIIKSRILRIAVP